VLRRRVAHPFPSRPYPQPTDLAHRAAIRYARLGPFEVIDLIRASSWRRPPFREFVRDFVTDGEKRARRRDGTQTSGQIPDSRFLKQHLECRNFEGREVGQGPMQGLTVGLRGWFMLDRSRLVPVPKRDSLLQRDQLLQSRMLGARFARRVASSEGLGRIYKTWWWCNHGWIPAI